MTLSCGLFFGMIISLCREVDGYAGGARFARGRATLCSTVEGYAVRELSTSRSELDWPACTSAVCLPPPLDYRATGTAPELCTWHPTQNLAKPAFHSFHRRQWPVWTGNGWDSCGHHIPLPDLRKLSEKTFLFDRSDFSLWAESGPMPDKYAWKGQMLVGKPPRYGIRIGTR